MQRTATLSKWTIGWMQGLAVAWLVLLCAVGAGLPVDAVAATDGHVTQVNEVRPGTAAPDQQSPSSNHSGNPRNGGDVDQASGWWVLLAVLVLGLLLWLHWGLRQALPKLIEHSLDDTRNLGKWGGLALAVLAFLLLGLAGPVWSALSTPSTWPAYLAAVLICVTALKFLTDAYELGKASWQAVNPDHYPNGVPPDVELLDSQKRVERELRQLDQTATSQVIGLQGEWGAGKTFLLRHIAGELDYAHKRPARPIPGGLWEFFRGCMLGNPMGLGVPRRDDAGEDAASSAGRSIQPVVWVDIWEHATEPDLQRAVYEKMRAHPVLLYRGGWCRNTLRARVKLFWADLQCLVPRLSLKWSDAAVQLSTGVPLRWQSLIVRLASGSSILFILDELDRAIPRITQAAVTLTRRSLDFPGSHVVIPYVNEQMMFKVFNPLLDDGCADLKSTAFALLNREWLKQVENDPEHDCDYNAIAADSAGRSLERKPEPVTGRGALSKPTVVADTGLPRAYHEVLAKTYMRLSPAQDGDFRLRLFHDELADKYLSYSIVLPKYTPLERVDAATGGAGLRVNRELAMFVRLVIWREGELGDAAKTAFKNLLNGMSPVLDRVTVIHPNAVAWQLAQTVSNLRQLGGSVRRTLGEEMRAVMHREDPEATAGTCVGKVVDALRHRSKSAATIDLYINRLLGVMLIYVLTQQMLRERPIQQARGTDRG